MKYSYLGTSSLKVSQVGLGVANFGSRWGERWTLSKPEAEKMVIDALDAGINFFDTANIYNGGESELWLGEILKNLRARERSVIATKFGYRTNPADQNSGGSGRRTMFSSVETSLKRLNTSYIDILYLHLWDGMTSVEETLGAAADLISSGKIRYFGLSNVPSWYLARSEALCDWRGWPKPIALQLNYNMLARHIESEFLCYLKMSDVGFVAWGALANGLLSGKYSINLDRREIGGKGRMSQTFTTGDLDPFRNSVVRMLDSLKNLVNNTGYTAVELSLAWIVQQEHVNSIILGASSTDQLRENIAAAGKDIEPDIIDSLTDLSAVKRFYPHSFLDRDVQMLVHGDGIPI